MPTTSRRQTLALLMLARSLRLGQTNASAAPMSSAKARVSVPS